MHDSPTSKIDTLKNLPRSIFVPSFSGPAASTPVSTATFALSQKIDQLSGTSLSNVTISNSTISAASIPDLSSSYLPIAGGTVSGTLSVAGTFTAGGLYSEFAPNQSNPVLSPTGSELLTAFGSVLKVGSTYYYYYMYSPDGTGGYAIGRATSSDGVNWTKDTANNPIFTKAASGWDSSQVGVPNVWVEGSTWYMLYRGWGADGHSRGGLATSPDGITWTRAAVNNCAGTTGNGCVLDLGNVSGGTEDIEFFGIIKVGSTYYASIDNPGGTNRGVGIATSTDLTDWTKNSSNPLFT
jgi:hypothetical protein